MRIAFIGQKGIDIGERGGGIEQHVAAIAVGLADRGHNVTVYARKKYRPDKPLMRKDITIRYIPTIYSKNIETILFTFLSTFHALFQPYDIIHYQGVGPSTLSWIPRLLKRHARIVATFHSQDRFHKKWGAFARAYLHFGEWATCTFPHATVSVSHIIQVYCRKHYGRQVVFIPNGAFVQSVQATNKVKEFGLEPGKYLLNVSRLIPHKGQHYLIEAYQELQRRNKERFADMKLVFVGAPSYTHEYEVQLKELADKNSNILFLGYQSGEELKQLFAHAYLYIQPSESEGLPLVVLEAMSYGRPVLVSDIPENLEAMHHAGFSFHNKDAAHLSKKIEQLLVNQEIVSEAAKTVQGVIESEFHWDAITAKTEAVYRTVRH